MSLRQVGYGLLAVCLITYVAVTTLLEPGVPAGIAYDLLMDEPLKCSEFFGILENRYTTKTLLTSYSTLASSAPNAVLVMMGPTEPFTSAEESALESFIRGGGTIILIADNDGTGHGLSIATEEYWEYFGEEYETTLKVSEYPLRDLESFEKRPDFVLLKNFSSHAMVENVSSILTNYPTVVVPTQGFSSSGTNHRVNGDIAWTSSKSFLDMDGDGLRDADEPAGTFSVIAVKEAAGGQLVVIADPGIFVNDMIDRANNRQFAISLFEWATGSGAKPIVFDLTHGGYAPAGWVSATAFGGAIFPTLAVLFFAAFLVAMGIAWGQKIGVRFQRRTRGRLSREMERFQKRMGSAAKTSLNEPLMVYYEQFLERCVKAFRLKEPDEDKLLKRIKAEYPKYYRQLEHVINVCGQVRVGARDVRSPSAVRGIIEKMSRFEKELGAKV